MLALVTSAHAGILSRTYACDGNHSNITSDLRKADGTVLEDVSFGYLDFKLEGDKKPQLGDKSLTVTIEGLPGINKKGYLPTGPYLSFPAEFLYGVLSVQLRDNNNREVYLSVKKINSIKREPGFRPRIAGTVPLPPPSLQLLYKRYTVILMYPQNSQIASTCKATLSQ